MTDTPASISRVLGLVGTIMLALCGTGSQIQGFKHAGQTLYQYSFITIPSCLSQGLYSCTNIMTKKHVGEERVNSAYIFEIIVHHWRKSGQEPGGRNQCRSMEECCFLALLPKACSVRFLYTLGPPDQRCHPQWAGLSKSSNNQDNPS